MLKLNVEAVADLCAIFVPGMVDRGRGAVLNVAYELETSLSMINFVAMGNGCAIVPEYVRNIQRDGIVYKPLGPPSILRSLAIIKRKGRSGLAEPLAAARSASVFRARVARAAGRSWRRCLRPSRSSRDVPPASGYVAAAASPARWAPVRGAAAEQALRLLADRAGQPSGPRPPDVAGANTAGRASGFVPVLDRPFQVAVAFPRAGDLPGDTGVFDDLHQPGTLTPEVLGNPCG